MIVAPLGPSTGNAMALPSGDHTVLLCAYWLKNGVYVRSRASEGVTSSVAKLLAPSQSRQRNEIEPPSG